MHDRSQFYGMDPETSRQGARQMDDGASQVQGMVDQVSRMLEGVTWIGADAQRFMQDWNGSLRPELQQATDALQQNAAELNRRAQMQEEASS